jgi:hypothetical protein
MFERSVERSLGVDVLSYMLNELQEDREVWKKHCEGKPYLTDDEANRYNAELTYNASKRYYYILFFKSSKFSIQREDYARVLYDGVTYVNQKQN